MKKLLVAVIFALGVMTLPSTAGAADPAADETAFVSRINDLRASKGLPALEVHPNLVQKAQAWATTMGEASRIWHSTLSDGITADWLKLGENVGMGGGVETLHSAFVASPKHYENLVDPAFGYIGIGVAYVNDTLFVSEMFMKLAPGQETPTASAPVVATSAAVPPPAPTTTTTPPAPPTTRPAPRPRPAPTTTTTTTAPPPATPDVASDPVPVTAEAPTPEPPKPSPLLVSVLERLRDFS